MTIKDIAKMSGYGVSTVSRVLNNQPNVSAKTRKDIEDVVKSIGFVTNNNAKNLKQTTSNCIGIVVKGRFSVFLESVAESIQSLIKESSFIADVLYVDDDNANEVIQAIQFCRDRKPLGIIFVGCNIDNFQDVKLPVPSVIVTANAENLRIERLSSVSIDDRVAGFFAVEHLIKRGHKSIGIIGGSLDTSNVSRLRYQGGLEAFKKYNIEFSFEDFYESIQYSYDSAYKAMDKLIMKNKNITAVFAMSDVIAIGSIRLLKDRGYNVPEDISIIGFDGIEIAEYYDPKITTIKQPKEILALKSVEQLINLIEDESNNGVHETIDFSIINGESVSEIRT